MKHIRQKHKSTCAIAALAMLLDKPYDKVYKQLHKKKHTRYTGTNWYKATEYLNKLKIKYETVWLPKNFDFRDLKDPAYVHLKIRNGLSHAVVWDPERKRILETAPKRIRRPRINVKYANEHCRYYIKILK